MVGGILAVLLAAAGRVELWQAAGGFVVLAAAAALTPGPRGLAGARRRDRRSGAGADGARPDLLIDRRLGDLLPDPLVVLGPGGRVRYVNRAGRALFGRAADEGMGGHVSGLVRSPALLEAVGEMEARAGARIVEYRIPVPVERRFRVYAAAERRGEWVIVLVFQEQTEMLRSQEMRSSFIADVSHELKTPLAVFTGYLEALSGAAREDAGAQKKFLGVLEAQAQRMARLVDDLLSLSRIESREHFRPEEAVDLAGLIEEAAADFEPAARKAKARIMFAPRTGLAPVRGSREELLTLIHNLLDNALRHGGGGRIEIGLSAQAAGHAVLSVRDFGEGIAAEHLPRLTERFYRTEPDRSRRRGGTGLGLAIVKHIVSRHQGELQIKSAGPGQGAVFQVRLPLHEGGRGGVS